MFILIAIYIKWYIWIVASLDKKYNTVIWINLKLKILKESLGIFLKKS